jgi:type I restriction enzyme S subunit
LDYITGGTRAKLNQAALLKIKVFSPSDIEEQKAIAQILSDMDSEIEALNKKLEKYKKIKQGMMEELLTGRVRLV